MKILLADDHAMMRDGLRALLVGTELEVVGEAASGREAVALAASLRPDLIVMDISMSDLDGIEATRRICAAQPGAVVIGLSTHADKRYVVALLKAGAKGYVIKNSASDELLLAVEAVTRGEIYTSPAIGFLAESDLTDQDAGPQSQRPLTLREREVLRWIAEGKSSKEIAAQLRIALPTVETHRRQIMAKLGLHTIAELTKHAIREGLTGLEE